MKPIRFACDQSSGSRSAFGVAIYDPEAETILATYELRPSIQLPKWKRIQDLVNQVKTLMLTARDKYGPLEVRCESFVMRGVGGETLAWVVGGIIAHVPWDCTFERVNNISLKKQTTGSAKAEKKQMGEALLKRFSAEKNLSNFNTVQHLVNTKAEDALDALAIAIAEEVME